jgi:hypothetical protein
MHVEDVAARVKVDQLCTAASESQDAREKAFNVRDVR